MPVGDIAVEPDSVMIYGSVSDLKTVSSIKTKIISHRELKKSTKGVIELEHIRNFRLSANEVNYSINVTRYVEKSEKVKVTISNLPSDRRMVLFPSQIDITYRIPFYQNNQPVVEPAVVTVDYNDYLKSSDGRVIPVLKSYPLPILDYSINPQVVNCIITE
jgi:YbbR domain-containing protein